MRILSISFAIGFGLVALLFASAALAQEDTQPPTLVTFDFYPTHVDTALADQTFTATARITDDLSGIGGLSPGATVSFRSINNNQSLSFSFWHFSRLSGNDLDGIYIDKAFLPRYSAQGIWQLDRIILRDKIGNSIWFCDTPFLCDEPLAVLTSQLNLPTSFINGKDNRIFLPLIQ